MLSLKNLEELVFFLLTTFWRYHDIFQPKYKKRLSEDTFIFAHLSKLTFEMLLSAYLV